MAGYRAISRPARIFSPLPSASFFFSLPLSACPRKPQDNDRLLASLICTCRIVLFDAIRRQEARFCLLRGRRKQKGRPMPLAAAHESKSRLGRVRLVYG